MIEQLGRSSCRIYQVDGEARVIRPDHDARAAMFTGAPPRRATDISITSIMTRERDLRAAHHRRGHARAVNGACITSERSDRQRARQPLGMVTKLDLVEQLANLSNRTAEDVMMPLALTLDEYATVADASAIITTSGSITFRSFQRQEP